MTPYIMLTRLSLEAASTPDAIETLERRAMAAVREECPTVEWLHSWAVLGPYDYVDVFQAPDPMTATRVATLVRLAGHATTEVWVATDWRDFRALMRDLPEAGRLAAAAG